MSQKVFLIDFKWDENISEFDGSFIKSYNDESDEWYFLEVYVQYNGKLHDFYKDLPFLSKEITIQKVEKLIADLPDKKTEHVIHKNLKQALNHGLVLSSYRAIKFNQKSWLKQIFVNMKTDLKRTSKNNFEKDFSSWWIIQFLVKLWKIFKFIGTLNLKQQKKKKLFDVRTKTTYYKVFTGNLLKWETFKYLWKSLSI